MCVTWDFDEISACDVGETVACATSLKQVCVCVTSVKLVCMHMLSSSPMVTITMSPVSKNMFQYNKSFVHFISTIIMHCCEWFYNFPPSGLHSDSCNINIHLSNNMNNVIIWK